MTKRTKEPNLTERQLKTAETINALVTTRSQVEAAELLGVNISTIKRRLSEWGIRETIAEMTSAAEEKLILNSEKAAHSLVSKIDSEDEGVSMKASTEVLDRAGVTKKQSGATVNVNFNKFIEGEKDTYGF